MIDDWMREIQKVSRKAAHDWPGVVDAEDLVQEVCLHILERPGTQDALSGMDEHSRYRTLHKIAQRIASGERRDYERFSGNFRYSVDEVRSLLESTGHPEAAELGSSWSVGEDTRSGGETSDPTGNAAIRNVQASETRKQLQAALEGLKASNQRQHDALVGQYVHGVVPPHGDAATRMLIQRALTSLTDKMNRAHKRQHVGEPEPYKSLGDGPGSRRAISNSTSRHLTKDSWDADYAPAPSHLRDNHIEAEVWA